MAKAVAVKKPALAKPSVKVTPKVTPKKPEKSAAPSGPKKEVKPVTVGEIAIFQGYTKTPEDGALFTEGEEIALVGQREENGETMFAAVKVADFHKWKDDETSVSGQELMVSEIKRTSKTVPEPYKLPVVGDMNTILSQHKGDPRDIAVELWNNVEKNMFYIGGLLCRLYKEKTKSGASLFSTYKNPEDKPYEDSKAGFEAFVHDNFGDDFGKSRKIYYYMDLYENVAALKDPEKVIRQLGKDRGIGWWKAATLIAPHITDENADELIKDVQQKVPYDELKQTIVTKYTTAGGVTARGRVATAKVKLTAFTFRLFEHQAAGVEYILAQAKRQIGISDDNQVFEHIVAEWAGDHLSDAAKRAEAAVARKRKALEKQGVKFPGDVAEAAE